MQRRWFTDMGLILLFMAVLLVAWVALAEPRITIYEAWAPPMPPVALTAAFYMHIRNAGNTGDTLRGAHSPACTSIELHESFQKPGGATLGMSGVAMGAMGMRPVPDGVIAIPAQSQVELRVDGFHLMCLGKRQAFDKNALLSLTLQFETAGEVTVPVRIREP